MRRILVIFVILILLLCSCGYSDNGYNKGFADGYAAGYAAANSEMCYRSLPEETTEDHSIPDLTQTERSAPTNAPADDFPVYVSRNGVMHKKSNCSGMIHYTEMPYSVAKEYYTQKCSKCFK